MQYWLAHQLAILLSTPIQLLVNIDLKGDARLVWMLRELLIYWDFPT